MSAVRERAARPDPPTPVSPRPWWMTAMAFLCVASLALNVPRDLLFEAYRDVEVWGGFELHGVWALLTAPLHWAIFAIGAWAFWTGRRWVVPVAAGYAFYVAASHLVWSEVSPHGRGWRVGLLQMAALSLPGFLLLWGHASLRRAEREGPSPSG